MLRHKYTHLNDLITILVLENIFFLHAIKDDTIFAWFRKGKLNFLKMFQKHSDLYQLAQPFQEENCSLNSLFEIEMRVFLAINSVLNTKIM